MAELCPLDIQIFFTCRSKKVILSSFIEIFGFLCSNRILNYLLFADVFTNHFSAISWTMKIPFVCYLQNTAHLQAPKEQFLKALCKYLRSLCNQFLCWINEMKHRTLIKKKLANLGKIIKSMNLHLKTWWLLWDCKKNLLIQVNFWEY